ncbi:hypothetical protein RSAG8_13548, partial [Rhizoctonia solani AG-8 WAC10335]
MTHLIIHALISDQPVHQRKPENKSPCAAPGLLEFSRQGYEL